MERCGIEMPHTDSQIELKGLFPKWWQRSLSGFDMRLHTLHSSGIQAPTNPSRRFTLRNFNLVDCEHWACNLCGVILQNVTARNLTGGQRFPTFLWGCAFSNVVLTGTISGIMFRWQVDLNDAVTSQRYREANALFYKSADLALDVSQAKFSTLNALFGIPTELIRRDATSQFIMSKSRAQEIQRVSEAGSALSSIADDLLASGLDDVLVVLGHKDKKFRERMAEFEKLREQGFIK
jgi:hypothetical protein